VRQDVGGGAQMVFAAASGSGNSVAEAPATGTVGGQGIAGRVSMRAPSRHRALLTAKPVTPNKRPALEGRVGSRRGGVQKAPKQGPGNAEGLFEVRNRARPFQAGLQARGRSRPEAPVPRAASWQGPGKKTGGGHSARAGLADFFAIDFRNLSGGHNLPALTKKGFAGFGNRENQPEAATAPNAAEIVRITPCSQRTLPT